MQVDGAQFNTGNLETRYGIHGGYGNSQGSGSAWGANIWGMGTSYDGSGYGTSFSTSGQYGISWIRGSHASADGSIGEGLYVYQNGVLKGGVGTSGIWSTGNITAYSDIRVKANFEVIPDALNKVCKLTGYTFDRTDTELRQTGLIAQELLEVLPEAVTGGPTEEDPDALYSVAYGNTVGLLVEAIKELKAEVEALKKNSHTHYVAGK
jgi:hypothetical protein